MILRKPPASATVVQDYLNDERGLGLSYTWLQRYFALRRLGLVMPLLELASDGRGYWVADDPVSLWRSKHLESCGHIRQTIEEHERIIADARRAQTDAA